MNIVVVSDYEWSYGETESFFDSSTMTVYVKHSNSVIVKDTPVESIPIEDESEIFKILNPEVKQKEFSLTDYASQLTDDTPIQYSSKETVDKIMNIKKFVEEDIARENLEKAKKLQLENDLKQSKLEMEENIKILSYNLDNALDFIKTF